MRLKLFPGLLFLILLSLVFSSCFKDDDCESTPCPDDVDGGLILLSQTTTDLYHYEQSDTLIFINDDGDELTFISTDGLQTPAYSVSKIDCLQECSTSNIDYESQRFEIFYKADFYNIAFAASVAIPNFDKDAEDAAFVDFIDIITSEDGGGANFMSIVSDLKGNTEFESESTNTDFANSITLLGKTFTDVYIFEEGPTRLYFNHEIGVVGFRNSGATPFWVYDRTL